jgi:hypothetical protein
MERSYGPKDWANKGNRDIAKGVSAAKKKVRNAVWNIDDAVTRRIPDKADNLVSTLKKGGGKIGLKGKQTARAVKAGVSQSKLMQILKKIFRKV